MENIYDFYFCLCANGLKMRKGVDFDQAHLPIGSYKSICMMLALSAGLEMTIYELDVDNSFQCTPKINMEEDPPLHITMPPLYMH